MKNKFNKSMYTVATMGILAGSGLICLGQAATVHAEQENKPLQVGEQEGVAVIGDTADFTYEGSIATGISEQGKRKLESGVTTLVIPAKTAEGEWITEIGDMAFSRQFYGSKLTKVDFSKCNHLTKIGRLAFWDNRIAEVDLAGLTSLEFIGDEAFSDNRIVTLNLSGCTSLTTIGVGAFAINAVDGKTPTSKDITLKEIDLSGCSALNSIDAGAFYGQNKINTINMVSVGNVKPLLVFDDENGWTTKEDILEYSPWFTKSIEGITRTVYTSNALEELDFTDWEVDKVIVVDAKLINYIDTKGNKVAEPRIFEHAIGEPYSLAEIREEKITSKEGKEFKLDKVEGKEAGTYEGGKVVLTYVYQEVSPEPEKPTDPDTGGEVTPEPEKPTDPDTGGEVTPEPEKPTDPDTGGEVTPEPEKPTDPDTGGETPEPEKPTGPEVIKPNTPKPEKPAEQKPVEITDNKKPEQPKPTENPDKPETVKPRKTLPKAGAVSTFSASLLGSTFLAGAFGSLFKRKK